MAQTYEMGKGGWFLSVGTRPVRKRKLEKGYSSGWKLGHPKGVLLHATAGCNPDIFTTLTSRGISAHFNVDRDGNIFQYVSLLNTAFHAYDASHVYYGMETTALAGTCNHTEKQMEAIIELSAALVEFTKRRWDFNIPLTHPPGSALVPGFREHRDGTKDGWNPNVHTDGVINYAPAPTWKGDWGRFFAAIEVELGGRVVYVVKGTKFAKLRNALRRLKALAEKAQPGDDLHIKVRQG